MATNSHMSYQEQKKPQLLPDTGRLKRKRPDGAILRLGVGIAAVVLLGAITYFLLVPKHAPGKASISARPLPSQLQFHGLQVIAGPTDNSFYLVGHIRNTGPDAVTGILAEVKLRGPYENVLLDVKRPLEGMSGDDNQLAPDPFTKDPLEPNDTRPFRLSITRAPDWWNHNIPEVQIVSVTGQGG